VRTASLWAGLLGIEGTTVKAVELDLQGRLRVAVRLRRGQENRCGICHRRCARYDHGGGVRRWRVLDLGATPAYLEAPAPRVRCRRHGVVVAAVPWARHGSRFSRTFEDQVAWLVTRCDLTAVAELMRVAWRSVGAVIARVSADAERGRDRLAGLRRIGIDEISCRRGQRYLTVVVDHDRGELVWARPGRDEATLERFFDELGPERCRLIRQVSADAASWVARVVARRCPQAVRCMDPFHVVAWATAALDQVRREVWNQARRAGQVRHAADLKGARWALWKNAQDLTRGQQARLAWIQRTNRRLYRAYLLKEQLREVFRQPYEDAIVLLDRWLKWAIRSRLAPFVEVAQMVIEQMEAIEATLDLRLSNARVEAINTRLRLIARRGYGFHTPDALIALAMLTCGAIRPALPGRAA
jgi:transposase